MVGTDGACHVCFAPPTVTYTGAEISPHFDSMLAKLTCRGRTYEKAVERGIGNRDEHLRLAVLVERLPPRARAIAEACADLAVAERLAATCSTGYFRPYTNTDVVGDIDIEIKLNRSGTLRLNLFSHSADQYTNYLDNSQRNGIGMGYQMEFNGIRDEDRFRLTTLKVEARDTTKVQAHDTKKVRKAKTARSQKKARRKLSGQKAQSDTAQKDTLSSRTE